MWIADSDFKAPQPVVDALVARMQQGVYGYTPISERLKKAGAGWQKKRFGWDVDPEWVEFVPGVIDLCGTCIEPARRQHCDPVSVLSAVLRSFRS